MAIGDILKELELGHLNYIVTDDIIKILSKNYEYIKGEPTALGPGFGIARYDYFLKEQKKIYHLNIGIEGEEQSACYTLSKNSKEVKGGR